MMMYHTGKSQKPIACLYLSRVELPISTLSRILKVTQFHKTVSIMCEPGLPVRLMAQLGIHGSQVNVYIQQQDLTGKNNATMS